MGNGVSLGHMVQQESDPLRVLILHGCCEHFGKEMAESGIKLGFIQGELQSVAAGLERAYVLIEEFFIRGSSNSRGGDQMQ